MRRGTARVEWPPKMKAEHRTQGLRTASGAWVIYGLFRAYMTFVALVSFFNGDFMSTTAENIQRQISRKSHFALHEKARLSCRSVASQPRRSERPVNNWLTMVRSFKYCMAFGVTPSKGTFRMSLEIAIDIPSSH